MNSPYEGDERGHIRDQLMGLGRRSIRKSYYPELQERGAELERFRALMEHVSDAIFFVDMSSMTVVDANAAATIMTGSPLVDLKKTGLAALLHESGAELFRHLSERCDDGLPTGTWCTRLQGSGDRLVPVEVTFNMHRYGDQEYAVLVARDISERLRYEEELIRARKEAEAASRAKGEFLATMSHEIRTPLNGILGMAELLFDADLAPREHRLLGLLKKSGCNLHRILNDILDFSKMEAGRFELAEEEFDLPDLVTGVADFFAARADGRQVRISAKVPEDLHSHWKGDGGRIQQVLMNIVGNPVKFTREGEISVSVQEMGEAQGESARELLFSVRDTGEGIPEEKLDTVFESFRQVDGSLSRAHQGTGLGLAICKQLVELMGGTIWVSSREGEGCNFFFTLRLKCLGEAGCRVKPDTGASREPKMHVLVVEDNKVNRVFARHLLTRRGHKVTCAVSGLEVLELLERQLPDCILMDIQMPGMDGLEATRCIRENVSREIPVIALTAHAMKGDRERFMAAGMDDYLTKPLDPEALWSVLARVAEKETPLY